MPELNQVTVLRNVTVNMPNDEQSPGANKVYGTNSSGTKGWKNDEKTITVLTKTSSHTLELSDAGKIILMNSASANNVTVPPNSSVAFEVGASILVNQYGAGQTSIVAGSGVTIRSTSGNLDLSAQYAGASLIKIGTNEWLLVGNLTA